ncbi:MAG: FAD-dependent oxidoreductase, partial [Pseudonocardia sp.]|nr:FAD-dependent oxidoreductase [Pseudonocardia sp.]
MTAGPATAERVAVPEAPDGATWDVLVVGGGTAGLVGARTAASFGASVLMVEHDRPGGDCLWTGCVPSKALLAAASAAADARAAAALGVHVGGVRVAFDEVMGHVRGAIATIEPVDSADAMRAAGVAYASGSATFTGPGSARVDGTPVRFRQALIATGSDPTVPPIPGLADADPLTSDSVWHLIERPDRLVVLGGGTVGCELGQAFARLGSTVTIVEALDRVLANEDADAARLVTAALTRDGVTVLTGTPVTAVEGTDVVLDDGRLITADRVLVAVGRRPDTRGLGLDAAR